ncbi:sugar phosphate isomerase/epimerase family protein [Arthrobacter sp. SD76]|uniref:sugar phosphate isomerase/epimerase family protein n=1 Tax=Arthrobacter sp. SD76 TaxID=3415007 RepID=UPI003C76155B
MFMGARDANGQLVMQQVADYPELISFDGIPERIKRFGVNSVELMEQNLHGTSAEDGAAFRAALEREGVKVGLLGLSRCVGDTNDQHRAEDLDELERLIESAAEVEAEQVRVVLMPPPIVSSPTLAPFDVLVDSLRRLSAKAKAAGVRLTVENEDVVTSDPDQLIPILDAIGTDIGLVLDTGNVEPLLSEVTSSFLAGREPKDVADPEPAYRMVEALLPRAEVVHVRPTGSMMTAHRRCTT